MKRKLQQIAFFYVTISSVAAYLLTAVSVLAHQNWHEYFVTPAYLFCQLLAAGWILKMPAEVILSLLPLVFICIGFVLYLKKNGYSAMFIKPVLLSVMIISGIYLAFGEAFDKVLGLIFLAFGVAFLFCLHGYEEND